MKIKTNRSINLVDQLGTVLPANTYPTYDSTWTLNPKIPSVTSINATPGNTWVSLSWAPPPNGLGNNAGYVVCRSAKSPPTTLSGEGIYIVYVGTGYFIGDRPLSQNTADLLTADLGLLADTTYYYSVFVVSTIAAGDQSGSYSNPVSITVSTTNTTPKTLVNDPSFTIQPNVAGYNQNGNPTNFKEGAWNVTFVPLNDPSGTPTKIPSVTLETDGGDMMLSPVNNYIRIQPNYAETKSPNFIKTVIYQRIETGEELIPGTLYSASFWFRTNNPLNYADWIYPKQSYTPSFIIDGMEFPVSVIPTNKGIPLGNTQIEQSIINEVAACKECTITSANEGRGLRAPDYRLTGSNTYGYNNYDFKNVWVRGGLTFTIGSSALGPINPYETTNDGTPATYGTGDPVQTPIRPPAPIASLGTSFTISIEIPPGLIDEFPDATTYPPIYIDITDVNIVKGLIPYSEPFWQNSQKGSNLVSNPNLWGVFTETVGCTLPYWLFTGPAAITNGKVTTMCGYENQPYNSSCTGGLICFQDPSNYPIDSTTKKPIVPSACNPFITSANKSPTYVVLTGGDVTTALYTANWQSHAFSLDPNPKTPYTLSFEYACLSLGEGKSPSVTLNILVTTEAAGAGSPILTESITFTTTSKSFTSQSYQLTMPSNGTPFSPNYEFNIYKGAPSGCQIAITNISLQATGNEILGSPNPFPIIPTPPSTTNTTPNNSIVWRMPQNGSGSLLSQLFNNTAYLGTNTNQVIAGSPIAASFPKIDTSTPIGSSQGLVVMSKYGSHTTALDGPDYISIIQDTYAYAASYLNTLLDGSNSVLALTSTNLAIAPKGMQANAAAYPMSNSYYGSGQWDLWVRLGSMIAADGTILNESRLDPNSTIAKQVHNPVGNCFAYWLFHYIDLSLTGDAKSFLDPSTIRNTEIDIEMNGDCPDSSSANFSLSIGRLNGWGGQWGTDGQNFTMHTLMPEDKNGNPINLDDGLYHKLSIIVNSGVDETPDLINPNGKNPTTTPQDAIFPTVRKPGFVRWLVDDIEWGRGWTGNSYGLDNVPMTATRVVLGPWNPTWTGSCICTPSTCTGANCTPNCPCCQKGICTSNPEISPDTATLQTYCGWQSVTFYIAQLQFTPTCTDNPNHVNLPITFDSPNQPTNIGASNRNRWLAEQPINVYPPV